MKNINDYNIYAVCGSPILHSKSPLIYNELFNYLQYPAFYTRIASDNPKEILAIASELNISGLNITAPFKEEIFKMLHDCDDYSKEIEAINTVTFNAKQNYGFNTDVIGVIETIKQNKLDLNNKECMIVGYGNAAKAAVFGIKKEWENANVFIIGRSKKKIDEFSNKFNCNIYNSKDNINPYLIISTIPRNAYYDINKFLLNCEYFMDAAYPDSMMSGVAGKYKCEIIPGEEWLINQALAAFRIFTGKEILPSYQKVLTEEILLSGQNDKKENKRNIFLTGFSGSGKTSIGKLLSEKLGYLYFDTDKLIEERENKSINNIFSNFGEEYFRNVEKEVLNKISHIKNSVISCGGGTLLSNEAINLTKNKGNIIWLHATLKDCLKRLNVFDKPMLKMKSELEIENLYNNRKYLYCKSSDLLVSNSDEISKTVGIIENELNLNK
ncbi:MAG: hypothetical protein HZB41_08635 [Ignavibacteriae bacterium]|nr:hypothetical protein [Ignavibacteriota bacterium]